MSRLDLISRVRRLGPKLAVFILGDRALLRPGGPSALSRLLGLRMPFYRPHPYTLYELNPEWRSADGRSRHNTLGFRGDDVAKEKAPGLCRIVCMGESTTYCAGIDDDRATYPARLEQYLRTLRPKRAIEVINAGVGGYTSIENLLRFHFHVGPLKPDLVIYYYTHNDVHPRRMPCLSRDYREYSRSWYEPPFGGGLRGWLVRRRALASGDIGNLVRRYDEYVGRRQAANVAKNPPEAFQANMTALAHLVCASGARLMIVNPPYRDLRLFGGSAKGNPAYRAVFEHCRIVDGIGERLAIPVYDLARDMPYPHNPKAFPNEHFFDAVHVNENGAALMGRLIGDAVIAANLMPDAGAPLG